MRWLALCWLAIAASAIELAPTFAAARVGDLLTWDVRGAPPAWLSEDVERGPTLELTAPDESQVRRRAFLMRDYELDPTGADAGSEYAPVGAPRLQIRHTPRAVGIHHWRLLGPDGQTLLFGDLVVAGSVAPPGPLRISPDNPRLLAFADGTPFIPLGLNLAWTLPPDRAGAFDRYFAALAAAGGNHARVWCASWCGQIESDDPDRYRLDHAWILDRALAAARAHGVRLTLVVDNHHDFVYGKCCPYGGDFTERVRTLLAAEPSPQYARRVRYLLARYGADDAIMAWELFNELDMACAVRKTCAAWVAGTAKLWASLDVDQRLRTVSWAGGDIEVVAQQPQIQLTQLRGYVLEFVGTSFMRPDTRDGIGLMMGPAQVAHQLGKPFCFSEVGYQGAEDHNPGNDGDPDGLLLRQQLWAGFLLGGYGSGMNWWWDVYVDHENLWSQYRGFATIVARIDWRETGLAPLTPNEGSELRVIGWLGPTQALLWPHHRDDTWWAHLEDPKQPKPRKTFAQAVSFSVAGFKPDLAVTIDAVDLVGGAVLATTSGRSDATGKLRLTLPAKSLDTGLVVKPAVAPATP